jgi:DNA-binding MarR family transcriptional regulator
MALLRYGNFLKDKNYDADIGEIDSEDKKYHNEMSPAGKGSVYVREVIVPELRARAQYFHDRWRFMKEKTLNVIEYKSQLRASASEKLRDRVNHQLQVSEQKVNKRASEKYREKVQSLRLERSNYIDGVIQYPFIRKFLEAHREITDYEFQVLVISYCHKWINIDDGDLYGYDRKSFSRIINALKKKGYIESFSVRLSKRSYVLNKKGEDLILEYVEQNRKLTKALFDEFDKKKEKKGEWIFASRNQKKGIKKIKNEKKTIDKRAIRGAS